MPGRGCQQWTAPLGALRWGNLSSVLHWSRPLEHWGADLTVFSCKCLKLLPIQDCGKVTRFSLLDTAGSRFQSVEGSSVIYPHPIHCAHFNLLNKYNTAAVGQIVLNYLLPIPIRPPHPSILPNCLAFWTYRPGIIYIAVSNPTL